MRNLVPLLHISLILFTTGSATATVISQGTLAAGSAASGSCAGQGFSSQNVGQTPNTGTCQTASTASGTVSTTASDSGTQFGHSWSGNSSSIGGVGTLKLAASTTGSSSTSFSGGEAGAGWNEQFTLTGGSGTSVWIVPLLVTGSMASSGLGARGIMQLRAYVNNNIISGGQAGTLFNSMNVTHNGAVFSGWSDELIAWGTSDYGVGSPLTTLNMSVNQVVWFALPFTWGNSFKVGFWADLLAGQIASGGTPVDNSTTADFSHTITWNGKGYVVNADSSVTTNFTINSTSGFDYNNAVTPEPSSWMLGLAGLAGLVAWRQKSRGV